MCLAQQFNRLSWAIHRAATSWLLPLDVRPPFHLLCDLRGRTEAATHPPARNGASANPFRLHTWMRDITMHRSFRSMQRLYGLSLSMRGRGSIVWPGYHSDAVERPSCARFARPAYWCTPAPTVLDATRIYRRLPLLVPSFLSRLGPCSVAHLDPGRPDPRSRRHLTPEETRLSRCFSPRRSRRAAILTGMR